MKLTDSQAAGKSFQHGKTEFNLTASSTRAATLLLLSSEMAHDVRGIVARLGLEAKQRSAVEAKASEYVRIATARLGAGGLGQVRQLPPLPPRQLTTVLNRHAQISYSGLCAT